MHPTSFDAPCAKPQRDIDARDRVEGRAEGRPPFGHAGIGDDMAVNRVEGGVTEEARGDEKEVRPEADDGKRVRRAAPRA